MSDKRFTVDGLNIQDTSIKGSLYLLDEQGGVNALCSLINGLNNKKNRLEKKNEWLKNKLNEQQATIEGLLLDRNRQEEKLDVAREKLKKQVNQMKRYEKSIKTMLQNMEKLEKENENLTDYIDTIYDGNTHICKHLDVEGVQFYCEKNENYRVPSCLYERCFDENNLVEVKDRIRECFE